MEGISHEAASLAGTLKLNKLIILYDSNGITIEGKTEIAFTENVLKRFEAYGFNTDTVQDGNDYSAVSSAIERAKKSDKPTFIEIKTTIGYGAPNKQGKASAHGEPLGDAEIKAAKENLGFNYPESFSVPDEVTRYMAGIIEELGKKEGEWNSLSSAYGEKFPEDFAAWENWNSGNVPELLEDRDFWKYEGNIATRVSSETVLNKLAKTVPNLFGGSADLAPSNKTVMKGMGDFFADSPEGRNVHFGVREHAMTAIANGIALHGGIIPYIAGFFIFSDYMKPAMRLAALMNLRVINVMTHDSIGVGEDGPTHQPVEQLAALRSIPNFTVIRPCDTNETAAAWYLALNNTSGPTALVLSRQNLPLLNETGKGALKGAYIIKDCGDGKPDVILMATGSEVSLIYKVYDILLEKGIKPRVVSMPSWEVFEKQSAEYKESVLPNAVRKRIAVEALSPFGWEKYTGLDGKIIAMNSFGASAPFDALNAKFGFTAENVVKAAEELMK
jgi:transketolase